MRIGQDDAFTSACKLSFMKIQGVEIVVAVLPTSELIPAFTSQVATGQFCRRDSGLFPPNRGLDQETHARIQSDHR